MRPISDYIKEATAKLGGSSESPRLDAELLLCFCLQKPREYLYTWPEKILAADIKQAFDKVIDKRIKGIPVAYLTGTHEFWSLPFKVSPAVLVPRPETELLVETTLKLLTDKNQSVLELGTGSGAIAIALASEQDEWEIIATDQSQQALKIATENAANLVSSASNTTIKFVHGDWFEPISTAQFDAIISNPPYIADADPHLLKLEHEPYSALASGSDGLNDIRQIINHAGHYLLDGGWLILEHGYDQQQVIADLLETQGYTDILELKDLNKLPRVIAARKEANPALNASCIRGCT